MTAPTVGNVADFIRDHVPTGFVNKYERLALTGTYTAYSSLTCEIEPLGMAIPSPVYKGRTYDLPNRMAPFDPWDRYGQFRGPVAYGFIVQSFRVHGDQIAAQMFRAELAGRVGIRASLYFSGATTDSTYKDVYGPKLCRARLLPIDGWLERSQRRTNYTNDTWFDVTLTWRQLSEFQSYTP